MKISHVRRAAAAPLAVAAVAGSSCCPVAAALEPGVHVDPGSPAAKEYALPLSQARQTGQGGSARDGSSGALFGAGIAPKRSGSLSKRGGSASRGTSLRGAHRPVRLGAVPAVSTSSASGALVRQGLPRASSDSTLALLGGGVLVLVLGAFLGVVLRGRRTVHSN